MEIPAFLVVPGFYIALRQDIGMELCFVALWSWHYFYRSCVFPFRLRTVGKNMPVVVVLMAFLFNLINGSLCGYYFARIADYPIGYIYDWRFITGLILFCGGWVLNWQADNQLMGLRSKEERGYQIPQGVLFQWISCPNLFGEVVFWCGFAMMVWALPTTAFALWTAANLVPRAIAHHQWYVQRFPAYPSQRKALIPFIL